MAADDSKIEEESSGIVLSSTKSTRVSLAGVRVGRYKLSKRRENLLQRVPNTGDYVMLEHGSLELMDLAYLSAKMGHEFAILRSKQSDVLFHGGATKCTFVGELEEGLKSRKYELVGHSHPGKEEPEPSQGDRNVLREIKQERSAVISARTGRITEFTADPFEQGGISDDNL